MIVVFTPCLKQFLLKYTSLKTLLTSSVYSSASLHRAEGSGAPRRPQVELHVEHQEERAWPQEQTRSDQTCAHVQGPTTTFMSFHVLMKDFDWSLSSHSCGRQQAVRRHVSYRGRPRTSTPSSTVWDELIHHFD